MRCAACGKAHVQSRRIRDTFDFNYNDALVRIKATGVPVEVCPACGETYSGPKAAALRHEAICRTLGLLTPHEIRQLRERLRFTQAEFARLTGIGEATISRWERGRLLQNKAMDLYLRLISTVPKSRTFLQSYSRASSA